MECGDTLARHPHFFNQLSSGLDVVGLAGAWLTATANTNTFTYEIAPVFTIMETILLKKMYGIIGWGETEADGIFAPVSQVVHNAILTHALVNSVNQVYSILMNTFSDAEKAPTDTGLLEACNEMHAAYLFQPDKLYNVDFDTGHKTIQCGRHIDVFKLWLMWKAKGTCGFEAQINRHMELAKYFCKVLKKKDNFKLVSDAEYAVGFLDNRRYKRKWTLNYDNLCPSSPMSASGISHQDLNTSQKVLKEIKNSKRLLQRRLIEKGTAMISYQPCGDKVHFFRMVFSNLATRRAHVDYLIDTIERLGKDL